MKRLTFKDGRGRNTLMINGQEYHGPIADRLAAYEDTGVTPEGIFALQMHPDHAYADYVKTMWQDIGGMEWMEVLAKAYSEGRLIVLPCGTDVTIERNGLRYKGDHWNPPELTAFASDPTTRTGKRVGLFNAREVEAALEATKHE